MRPIRKSVNKNTYNQALFALIIIASLVGVIKPVSVSARSISPQATSPDDGQVLSADTAGEEEDDGDDGNILQRIVGTITHTIGISSASLYDAWTSVLEKSVEGFQDGITPEIETVTKILNVLFMRYSSQGLEGLVFMKEGPHFFVDQTFLGQAQQLWRVMFNVAVVFFPLTILVNLGSVLTAGVSAPVVRAEMLEGFARALITLAFCAGSFMIGSHMIKIGWGIAEAVRPTELQSLFGVVHIALPLATYGMFGVFVVFLITTVLLFLATALLFSHFAIIVVTVVLLVVSPLVIILGNFKPFSWLYWTWSKAFVTILLVPAANAVLMQLWWRIGWSSISLQSPVLGRMLSLGFLGLIISLNFTIGKLVYGPIMEATQKAWQSTKQLAASAVGIATAVVGGASASAAVAGLGGSGGSKNRGAGFSGNLPMPPLPGGGRSAAAAGSMGGTDRSSSSPADLLKNMSGPQKEMAVGQVQSARHQARSAASAVHRALSSNPFMQGAANLWSMNRENTLNQLEAAVRNTRPDAGAGGARRFGSQKTLNTPPSNVDSIEKALLKEVGGKPVEPHYLRPHINGVSSAKIRSQSINGAGHFIEAVKESRPDFAELLETAGISEGQLGSALAYHGHTDAFAPDIKKNETEEIPFYTHKEALNALDRMNEVMPNNVWQAAREYESWKVSNKDDLGQYYNRLRETIRKQNT